MSSIPSSAVDIALKESIGSNGVLALYVSVSVNSL